MKLTTGRMIPDKFLTDTVEGIVEMYASYGFSDWDTVVHEECHGMVDYGIERETYKELDENIALADDEAEEIMEIVEPIAKQIASALGNKFTELYNAYLDNGNKVWINPKLPAADQS